ncbi:hypothetical protein [Chitinophaga sp. MM2321]|uniref:hypothetical protein n=1 Tax=Chitinophaga sp. MM2321 TaxID=3137178 RepID=UPI0032D576BE
MPVELREARPGYYFALGKEIIEITEEDYPYLPVMVQDLTPIPINAIRLGNMGFERIFATGACQHSFNGNVVYLKPINAGRWIVQFEGREKTRYVSYIHEVQDFWYAVFGELLKRRGPILRPVYIPYPNLTPRFLFLCNKFVFAPQEHLTLELVECNYGNTIPWMGKNWILQQHAGNYSEKVHNDASAWLKIELKGK